MAAQCVSCIHRARAFLLPALSACLATTILADVPADQTFDDSWSVFTDKVHNGVTYSLRNGAGEPTILLPGSVSFSSGETIESLGAGSVPASSGGVLLANRDFDMTPRQLSMSLGSANNAWFKSLLITTVLEPGITAYMYTIEGYNDGTKVVEATGIDFSRAGGLAPSYGSGASALTVSSTTDGYLRAGVFNLTGAGWKSIDQLVLKTTEDRQIWLAVDTLDFEPPTPPFTRGITSFLQLGAAAGAESPAGSYATAQIDNVTLEAWVFLSSTAGAHHALINGNGGANGYGLYLQPGGKVSVLMGVTGFVQEVGASLVTNRWIHIAAVRNTVAGGNLGWRIYVDGQEKTTEQAYIVGPDPLPLGANSYVQIGRAAGDPAGLSVSEARIWKRALTAAEIQANMSGTVASNAADLVGFWRLADGTGTTVTDVQTNQSPIHLTISGPATWIASTAGSTVEDTALTGRLAGGALVGSVTYAKVSDPGHGSVVIDVSGGYTYTPTANYVGSDSFSFKVNNGIEDSAAGTVAITVTAVNDAPVLDNSKSPTLATIAEDTPAPTNGSTANSTLVSSLVDIGGALSNVTDADTGAVTGIAVTAVSAHGTLYYTTNGGATWNACGAVSAASALLLAADANTRIAFAPLSNLAGTDTDAITFKAWDRTSGGNGANGVDTTTGSAYSAATDMASIAITSVNDAPTIDSGTYTLTGTDENTTSSATQIATIAATLDYADVDIGAIAGIAVTSTTAIGTWQYSTDGATGWTNFGAVDVSAALLLTSGTYVRYVPDSATGETATFTFRAWDRTLSLASINGTPRYDDTSTNGGTSQFSTAQASASMTVSSVNDAPVFVGAVTSLTINANTGATSIKALLHASDPDSAQTLTWTESVAPAHGTLTFAGATAASPGSDITPGGTIAYTPMANYVGSDTFTVQVSDGIASATRTITVTVNAVATELRFTTQPSGSISGVALTGQPIVRATDAYGNVDTTFTGDVTLSLGSGAGSLSGTLTKPAIAGVATFTNIAYTATTDQQSFTLTTSNTAGLTEATSNAVLSDVVATKLRFATQPAPLTMASTVTRSFTTPPVVQAVDAANVVDTGYSTAIMLSLTKSDGSPAPGTVNSVSGTGDTDGSGTSVTLDSTGGAATFSGLSVRYTNSAVTDMLALHAVSGGLTAANSAAISSRIDTAPSVDVLTSGGSFTEGGAAVVVSSSVTVIDPDDSTCAWATVSIVQNFTAGQDVLSFTNNGTTMGNIAAVYDADTGVMTLTSEGATATRAQWASALGAVKYSNTSESPNTATRIVLFVVNDGYLSSDSSYAFAKTYVTVAGTNDAPTLSAGPFVLAGTDENTMSSATAVSAILAGLTHADADGSVPSGIAITQKSGASSWAYSTDGITWAAVGAVSPTSALLLTSTSHIRYLPNGVQGETATISLRAWDQTAGIASTNITRGLADASTNGGTTAFSTVVAQATMTVTSINDAPSAIGLPTEITVVEDTASSVDLSAVSLTDPDADAGDLTLTLTASAGTLSAISGGGIIVGGSGSTTLTLVGTLANLNAFLDTASNIRYTAVANASGDNAATITIKLNDNGNTGPGGALEVTLGTVNVDITAVNDAPTDITLALSSPTLKHSLAANSIVGTLSATDVDDSTFTYALVAGDGVNDAANASFNILDVSLRANDPASLAAGSHSVRVQASDGKGGIHAKSFTLTVVDDVAPAGHSVAFDDDIINAAEAAAVSFTCSNAEVGASYSYSISSSGGGATVAGSGTIAGATEQVGAIDVTGLADGTLTLSVTLTDAADNSAAAVTSTATLDTEPPLNTVPGAQATTTVLPLVFSSGTGNAIAVSGDGTIITIVSAGAGQLVASTGGSATITGNGTAAVTLEGSASAVSQALAGLAFFPSQAGAQTIAVQSADAAGNSDDDTIAVTIASATVTVTTSADTGDDGLVAASFAADQADGAGLGLREALHWALEGDTVTFDLNAATTGSQGGTITLNGAELTIGRAITIDGDLDDDGISDVTLSGNRASRVLAIGVGVTGVQLTGLILADGASSGGGGLGIGTGAAVTVRDSRIADNTDSDRGGGGIYGGSITLTLINTSVSNNTSPSFGGGIRAVGSSSLTLINCTVSGNATTGVSAHGGGIQFAGTGLTIVNSTISGNAVLGAGSIGGGLRVTSGPAHIVNSTIVGNAAVGGGGGISAAGTETVVNTVVAGNTSGDGAAAAISGAPLATGGVADDVAGIIESATHGYFGSSATILADSGSLNDQGTASLLLGNLAQNGGGFQGTHRPEPGSALIDVGNSAALPADSHDLDGDGDTTEPLPHDANGAGRLTGGSVDIGAVEGDATPRVVSVNSTVPDGIYTIGATLAVTVQFDQVVFVGGAAPVLMLEAGSSEGLAIYVSGSGSNTLMFNYTVLAGQASPDLEYTQFRPLSDGTSTIRSVTNVDADLTLPAVGSANSLAGQRNLVIDTAAPIITSGESATATYRTPFSDYTITASGDPVGFGATGLPAGLSIDPATGALTGSPMQVGSFAVTLRATDAAGNTGTRELSLAVDPAALTVSGISIAERPYDGTTTATAVVSGATLIGVLGGDDVTLVTSGATAVFADAQAGAGKPVTISGLSLSGAQAAGYTLTHPALTGTITKADQTVSFAAIGAVTVGSPVTLSATAGSGLPVTFSVLSGDAAITGTTLTVNSAGAPVVVRANQSGDGNYHPGFRDQTVAVEAITRLSQAITFAQPPDRATTDAAFTLSATASSGLTVAFAIESGPATVSGHTVTLTGAPGTVTVVASQAGNGAYAAAPSVTRSFAVTSPAPLIGFGNLTEGGEARGQFAVQLASDGASGTLLGHIPGHGGFILTFAPDVHGAFTAGTDSVTTDSTSASWTFQGQVQGNSVSGSLVELGCTFSATFDPPAGPTAEISGYYVAQSLDTSNGSIHTMIGTRGNVFVLAHLPDLVDGGEATLDPSSADFAGSMSSGVGIDGHVDASTSSVDGTIIRSGGDATTDFAGLKQGSTRNDRLINLSSRAGVGSGDEVVITGFVIGGSQPKEVLLRAVGPGLDIFDLDGTLADPRMTLVHDGAVVATNDNWGDAANASAAAEAMTRTGAFALASGSRDAAILTTLAPGTYTAIIEGAGGSGVALAEVYDASSGSSGYERLLNISTRGPVGPGHATLIAGFVVTGNAPKRVLIRGVGPGLGALGVAATLPDPNLAIFQGNTMLAQNSDWGMGANMPSELAAAAENVGAFALTAGSKDAAILITLAPGIYTAHVSPADGTAGIALVEVYEVP